MGTILDLGRAMLVTGAEVWRVEEIMEQTFETYLFKDCEVWVVASCIGATVYTWDDREYTQIRIIRGRSYDLDKLERLYELVDEVNTAQLGIKEIRERVDEIIARPGLPAIYNTIATVVSGAGFAFFYNGNIADALVVSVMCLAFIAFNNRIGGKMNNLLVHNAIAAFIIEIIAIFSMAAGVGHNLAAITTAGILLLAGGLGIANGIGDFLHGETLAGVEETSTSMLGAAGIAIGIYLSMLFFRGFLETNVDIGSAVLAVNPVVQIISCTIGCAGFTLMFGARKRALFYSIIGSFFTWLVYLLVVEFTGSGFFVATMASSCFVALYAGAVNAITKIPAAIFLTSCVFPLLPGSNLYYTVFGAVANQPDLAKSQGSTMLLVAIGIALGYISMDVVSKLIQIVRDSYFSK